MNSVWQLSLNYNTHVSTVDTQKWNYKSTHQNGLYRSDVLINTPVLGAAKSTPKLMTVLSCVYFSAGKSCNSHYVNEIITARL